MKQKIAKILTTFVLVLCVCLGLTACKKDDNKDASNAEAKVKSIAVELKNDSYELNDGTITKIYGGSYNLTSADFKVTATLEDDTTKVLSLKSDTVDGYTFSSTVTDSDIKGNYVQVGNYTLTFGYGDLTSQTIKYEVTKATFDTSVLTWTSEMKYNSTSQAPVITNALDYEGVVTISYASDNAKKAVSATGEHYTATATLTLSDTRNYVALTTEQETISHDWTMQKGDNPFGDVTINSVVFSSLTFNNDEQKIAYSGVDESRFEVKCEKNADDGQSAIKAKNAGIYNVNVTITYKGEDVDSYESSSISIFGVRTWEIKPQTISTNVSLKVKDGDAYADNSFTYGNTAKEVEFDLSSIHNKYFTSMTLANSILTTTTSGTFTATNAGTYTATITFTVNNSNYAVSDATVEKQWKINKANFGVFAKENQTFVYGKTQAEISTSAEFAEASAYNDVFVDAESQESRTEIYQALKTAITSYEIRLDSGLNTTAYTGKLNAGTYYLYPIIPSSLTFKNYDINPNGASFTITKKDLDGHIVAREIEYNETYEYDLSFFAPLTGFVNNETIESVITDYTFKFRPRTSTSDSDWTSEKPTAIGEYSVKFEANVQNYSVEKIEPGLLTIKKANVQIENGDINWNINNDNTIVPTYNEADEKWSATIEKTESAITYSLVISSKYGEIFDITYTDENGETLESITSAGEYTIKASVALKTDTSVTDLYNEFSATFTLEITITQNYFETSTASGSEGGTQKTISVVVTTTEEDKDTGKDEETEENLTFNEFASKTEFKEGDTVKFTLKDDPAAISTSDPSEEGKEEGNSASPASQVMAYATETRTFVRYRVLYNGEEVGYDSTEKCYIIRIVSFNGSAENKGLKIIKVYSVTQEEGEPKEDTETIFAKTNIKVQTKRDDNNQGQGGNPSVDFEIPASFKVGNKTLYTDNRTVFEQFYKLSATEETLTFTFDDEWINRNLYLVFGGQTYIEINATTLTIDMTAYLDQGVTLDFALYNVEEDHYSDKGLSNANIYPWSVVEKIEISYKDGDESGASNHSSNALDTGHRSNVLAHDGITGITLTFESGYTNYTYKITAFDHETVLYDSSNNASKLDFTKLNCYRYNQIWFIIYDADGNEVGSKGFDFTLDSGSEIPNDNDEVCAEITSVDKWKYPSVKADGDGDTTFNLTCSTENLTIYTFNNKGAYSFVLKDADGEEVFSDMAEENDYGELQGIASFDYRFLEAGTYTLTMTALDETTTRTFTITVTGEYVPTLDVSFDTDGDGEDKTLHCEIVDINDFTLTEDSDFRMGIDYENLTYSLDAYVGENHGLKITTKEGKKYVTLNSFETIYKDLYDLKKNKLTCPAELEVLTNLDSVEYVSFKLKITRSIWIVINVYFCEPSSDLEITLTGNESKNDKKLTCDITDQEAMTTEGDFEMAMVDADGDDIPCMVACVGDIETLGIKVTTTDGKDYISFTGLSSGLFLAMADETFSSPLGASGNLLLHEVDSIKFVRLYGMTADEQMVAIMICFCDKDDLPEGIIEANVMPS